MPFAYPTEYFREGAAEILVPKISYFTREKESLANAPVFYNPVMRFNRDIAVLTLRTYFNMLGEKFSVCEPMTGCGVRGVILALEVDGIKKVFLNDLNPNAYALCLFNVKKNGVDDKMVVRNLDANLFLSRYSRPRKRFNVIDVDPFGSPVPYIDSAIRALRNKGLLAVTATDVASLCGVYPEACLRRYGKTLRTEYCHEIAIRLVIGYIARTAAKYDTGIQVLFSHSTDHYIRIYARIFDGAKLADKCISKLGYILHCYNCLHREVSYGIASSLKRTCNECEAELDVAGPLWLGELVDKEFCFKMLVELDNAKSVDRGRLTKLLNTLLEEAAGPQTYYVISKACDKFNLRTPKKIDIIQALLDLGYFVSETHFNLNGLRTNATASVFREIVTKLS